MRFAGLSLLLLVALLGFAQTQVFVCPMDPDVRSSVPGKCPRCGMTLVAQLPEPVEYRMLFKADPPQIPANQNVTLFFRILDPATSAPVTRFTEVHERLFHLFLVSYDLTYFSHEHPVWMPDGWFQLETRLPQPGTYRLLADFDPDGGTPQLVAKTFSTAGFIAPLETSIARPAPDLSAKTASNMTVEMRTEPAQSIAGKKTMLFLHITPAEGLEKYIGAWAHMLAVSSDLIDTIHTHPFDADGGPDMQFNVIFPRAGNYRLWIQLQRKGVVNTVSFTVPVGEL